VFYTGVDWITTGIDANVNYSRRWNRSIQGLESAAKTIYDPSPRGWKMPHGVDWSGFTEGAFPTTTAPVSGRMYNGLATAFFPQMGIRSRVDGRLTKLSQGVYWSGSGSKGFGYALQFGTLDMAPSTIEFFCADGVPVRPVRE
jgi:hypothetical protein